jgi:hypothetical protein
MRKNAKKRRHSLLHYQLSNTVDVDVQAERKIKVHHSVAPEVQKEEEEDEEEEEESVIKHNYRAASCKLAE